MEVLIIEYENMNINEKFDKVDNLNTFEVKDTNDSYEDYYSNPDCYVCESIFGDLLCGSDCECEDCHQQEEVEEYQTEEDEDEVVSDLNHILSILKNRRKRKIDEDEINPEDDEMMDEDRDSSQIGNDGPTDYSEEEVEEDEEDGDEEDELDKLCDDVQGLNFKNNNNEYFELMESQEIIKNSPNKGVLEKTRRRYLRYINEIESWEGYENLEYKMHRYIELLTFDAKCRLSQQIDEQLVKLINGYEDPRYEQIKQKFVC
jgi:hypothetical protein